MPVDYLGNSGIYGICVQKSRLELLSSQWLLETMRGEFTCTDQGAGHEALWVKGRTQEV